MWTLALAQKKPAAASPAAKVELQETPELSKLHPAEAQKIRAAVGRPAPSTIWAVIQEFNGSFDSVGQHMDELEKELKAQKLVPAAGNHTGLLILFDEPHGGVGRMAVGVEVASSLPAKAPLKSEQFSAPQAVRYVHVGDYANLEHEHRAIEEVSKNTHKKGTSFPIVMRVLDDPRKVGPGRARIELVEKLQ
jgi:hypothetical protein